MRFLVAVIAITVAALIAPIGVMADAYKLTPALAPLMSDLAGKPVVVYCSSGTANGAAGRSNVGGRSVLFAQPVCETLLGKSKKPWWSLALVTVAHEAEHLKGITDESEADCNALKVAAKVGIVYYKLTRKQLHKIMDQAWAEHRAQPPEYRTRC